MNIKKHFKKFIVVLVLLILFNFCSPKIVHAGLVEDITAAPAKSTSKNILVDAKRCASMDE